MADLRQTSPDTSSTTSPTTYAADGTDSPERAPHRHGPVHDLGVLIARLALGAVMIAHGWQKWSGGGLDGTAQGFTQMGIPYPRLAAGVTIGTELIGGVLVILGLLLPVVALVYAAVMVGAIWFTHLPNGFYASNGGYEFVLVLAALSLALALIGAGRFSIDGAVGRSWRTKRAVRRTAKASNRQTATA